MRNFVLASLLVASACNPNIGEDRDPPDLKVTSPQRSLIRDHAGTLVVTGTVAPNASTLAQVKKVTVNNVPATLNADGTFTASIDLKPGATLVNTVATDSDGSKAEDTRSVEAGDLRTPTSSIENALTMALSANAFSKIAGAASTLIKTTDFKPLLASFNPVMHSGDDQGEDCLFARLYVDDFKLSNAAITLTPVAGGLAFSAKLDNVDVPGHVRWAVACASGENTIRVQASSALVSGTLLITPDGMNGFKTELDQPVIQLQNLNVSASGLPGTILGMLPIDSLIEKVAPLAAKLFMGPMVNKALGGLAGPKELMVLGKTLVLQVSPSAISFNPQGGLVTLDTAIYIKDTTSKGYIYTDNGMPALDPGPGLQLGIADDLANNMLSQLISTGLLDITMPKDGGTFDSTKITMTSPPMISADPADGKMRLILPDMMTTFLQQGAPVGKAAINATIELKITPSSTGYGISVDLGAPIIKADALDDIPNQTLLTDSDLAKAVELGLDSQIKTISALLGSIPLPAMPGGITLKDTSVTSDDGYVMFKATLE